MLQKRVDSAANGTESTPHRRRWQGPIYVKLGHWRGFSDNAPLESLCTSIRPRDLLAERPVGWLSGRHLGHDR